MANKSKRKKKHAPQRTCVGCRSVEEKRTLTRVVRTPDGVLIDPHGKHHGRGAYIHQRRSCWEKAIAGRLAQALKTKLSEADTVQLTTYLETLPSET